MTGRFLTYVRKAGSETEQWVFQLIDVKKMMKIKKQWVIVRRLILCKEF